MKKRKIASLLCIILILYFAFTQLSYSQSLEDGFKNPPESAKPRTWWHWTNSNITKEGITKDLEWMKRSGIGGFQLADAANKVLKSPLRLFGGRGLNDSGLLGPVTILKKQY